ncbi:hypothetical protein MNBD_ALPHA02-1891 [hydrothermal vent metagenome]|uniref:Flagellar trans-acting factor FliX n=1 Tax=hydrothermal vent metagenome TaxID=652676 RepID=A0A3B0R559_9ZZZZ
MRIFPARGNTCRAENDNSIYEATAQSVICRVRIKQKENSMEIKGSGRITTPGVSRKGKKGSAGKAGFSKNLSTDDVHAAAPPSGTSPLTSVSSLLSLQELPTSSEGRSKGLALAEDFLGHLEIIRHGLLAGQIPQRRLRDVLTIVARQRSLSNDPALDDILSDMELRVKVELAKLEIYGD